MTHLIKQIRAMTHEACRCRVTINNNYNNYMIKARVSVEGEASDEWTWGRGCKQQRLTDGRCVLFEMVDLRNEQSNRTLHEQREMNICVFVEGRF